MGIAAEAASPTPKAFVVMLDGVRADVIDNGLAPNLKSLADGRWQPGYGGAWSLSASTLRDGTTESAPNHIAIATGMTAKKSGIDTRFTSLRGMPICGSAPTMAFSSYSTATRRTPRRLLR